MLSYTGTKRKMFNIADSRSGEREQMVREQLISRGITNQRVLEAFRKVERHKFVTASHQASAYQDHPLPIGQGQTISQPYMVALMTECLNLKGKERVLEIGTGSGYQTAILAELADTIYSIERYQELAERAKGILEDLGYSNVEIIVGDGTLGWPEYSPYDGIIVTAGAPEVPIPLFEQLRESGRLVIPVGNSFSQVLQVVEKRKGKMSKDDVCSCVFVPLVGKYGWKS